MSMTTTNGIKDLLLEECFTMPSTYDGIYTKTTQFLLKSIGIDLTNMTIYKYFVNAYLNDKNFSNEYETPLFLLFGTNSVKEADWFFLDEKFRNHENYITDYDLGVSAEGKSLIMFVFDCPFKEDYYHFKAGRYSRFTPEYKDLFKKQILGNNGEKQESIIWGIINKSEKTKDIIKQEFGIDDEDLEGLEEYWDIPRKEREIYNYGKEEKVSCSC